MSNQDLTQIGETVDAILGGVDPKVPAQIDEKALRLLTEAGLRRVALPEIAGGSDGQLDHLAVVLKRLGYHAVNVPILEDHLAAELLVSLSSDVPDGLLTISSRSDLVAEDVGGRLRVSGRCLHVPWGRCATHVLAFAHSGRGLVLVALPVSDATVSLHMNVAGETRDTLIYDAVTSCAPVAVGSTLAEFKTRVLLYRSLMMLGAGERAFEMTTQYVTERVQFGRALAHRQVVQHYVAEMFEAVTATLTACDAAISCLADEDTPGVLAASYATRIEADKMASLVARLAHQLHGAIGFTEEHALHFSTTRLASWRQDDVSEAACALELSRLVPDLGGPWNVLTNRG